MGKHETLSKSKILEALEKVIDPELGVPITKMNLIDQVKVRDNKVDVDFHLSMPFCPPMFATMIAQDIKERLSDIGAEKVTVHLKDHFMAREINRKVNKS